MLLQKTINIDNIRIPKRHQRKGSVPPTLTASVESVGIKFPVHVVKPAKSSKDQRYILADGGRRIKILRRNGKKMVPAIVHTTGDADKEGLARLLRVIINHHRQDFYPSQRARYLKIHMEKFGISMTQMAAALGRSYKTVESWLRVSDCSDEIQMLINNGKWPIRSTALVGSLSQDEQAHLLDRFHGQPKVTLEEIRRAVDKIRGDTGKPKRRQLRNAGTQTGVRRRVTAPDRLRGLSLPEIAQRTEAAKQELSFMRKQTLSAAPIIKAIMKRKTIRSMLTADQLYRFEAFLQG